MPALVDRDQFHMPRIRRQNLALGVEISNHDQSRLFLLGSHVELLKRAEALAKTDLLCGRKRLVSKKH